MACQQPRWSALLEDILPPQVRVAEAYGDVDAPLFAAEAAAVARAVAKRRREFTTVRHCARRALSELGVAPAPIVPGAMGAPQWPADTVGSMTHCDNYRAAAVGRAAQVDTVGIDAEPHQPLPADVLALVAAPDEREHLTDLAGQRPDVHWDRLLFAAKESVYKAWYPLTARWLGFEEARVIFHPADGRFAAQLLVTGPTVRGRTLSGFDGRFIVRDGLALTAIAVTV